MRIIRKSMLSIQHAPTVATIGAYDGIHLGHKKILENLKSKAKSFNLISTVICFEPLPKEFFMGDKAPARLTLLRDKVGMLESLGIDQFVCIQFDKNFSCVEAESFIAEILVQSLNVKYLVVGDDFKFGKNRLGDFELLKNNGKKLGFDVEKTESYVINNERVSSSLIRSTIKKHNFELANQLLGYNYFISGRILHGKKLGRTIGYPTINIGINHKLAISGIYVVQVEHNNRVYFGVASIGTRPTVQGIDRLLEVYIFEFRQQIYGEHVKVIFLHFLRSEEKFESVELMLNQIKADEQAAIAWLANNKIGIQ
jgi:riboflavin kinase/FMN adenylyltransferase